MLKKLYYKKQLYITLFFLIVTLFGVYKKIETESFKVDAFLVNVEIVDVSCRKIGKKDYSKFTFKYKEKIFEQHVSEEKCKNLFKNTQFEIYYNQKKKSFLLPDLMEDNYYNKILIPLFIIVLICLVPYKKLL